MTDEWLCVVCGQKETAFKHYRCTHNWTCPGDCWHPFRATGDVFTFTNVQMTGAGGFFGPNANVTASVPAAPSTDEGEAQPLPAARVVSIYPFGAAKQWMVDGDEEGYRVPNAVEAAICAPLEERIRELEAEVSSWSTQVETSEEEAERLREALRNVRESAESVETWLRPLLCDEDVTVCSHPICSAWIAAGLTASNLRALATSSTEGTDTAADEGGEE